MSALPELARREARIAALLPVDGVAADRRALLAELNSYATLAVRLARERGDAQPAADAVAAALRWLARPVFICGHHRSGTTLLHELLDGHPDLEVLPNEATYFSSFGYVARARPSARDLERFAAEWICRLVDPNYPPHFRLGRTADVAPYVDFARLLYGWRTALVDSAPRRFAALLALVAACRSSLSRAGDPQRWVEKTPLNEGYVARLLAFPEARFIQMVRDPRAVFASLRELYRRDPARRFDRVATARAIGRSMRLALSNQRRLGARYLVIRYEDLAGNPATLERVREFLQIPANDALRIPTAGGTPVRSNSAFGAGPSGIVRSAAAPPALAEGDLALLRAFTVAPARALGYELGAASWRDSVSAWHQWLLPS